MISADWLLVNGDVETTNVALVEPAGTVTLAGTVAATVLSLDRATTNPATAAADVNVTVPVTGFPPTTSVTGSVTEDSAGATAVEEVETGEVSDDEPVPPEASAADCATLAPTAASMVTIRMRVVLIITTFRWPGGLQDYCLMAANLANCPAVAPSYFGSSTSAADFNSTTNGIPGHHDPGRKLLGRTCAKSTITPVTVAP